MIIDQVEMLKRYVPMHPLFANVADHLPEATSLADGKYPIIDDELFVIIETRTGVGKSGAVLESHRKYIDVQVPLAGIEWFGWHDVRACTVSQDFKPDNDIAFYQTPSDLWFPVTPGRFVIFYPSDAHAPSASDGVVRKAVYKVRVR